MPAFRCIPVPTVTAERFRRTQMDDGGNRLRRIEATEGGAYPCRHCLLCARFGEVMLLGSYHLPRPSGIY